MATETNGRAVRAGVIGFGLSGARFHAPLIAATPGLELAAVASSRAEAVRQEWPGLRVHASPEALIADPAIDLVVIATPNAQHAPLAHAALTAGKHVVIDKPFVADPAEGAALIALAASQRRVLSVFHNRRWDADFLTVRDLIAAGALGDVRLAELRWDRFRPAIKPGWREEPGDGAGLLADLGPHLIDQALCLFGRPARITADILTQRDAARVDDYFEIVLDYGPARVILSASTLVAAPRPRFALSGTRGAFVKYGIDPQEAALRAGGSPSDQGYGVEPPAAFGTLTDASGNEEKVPSVRGDWRAFYDGMAVAICDGAAPPVEPADALAGLDLVALARRSARERRTLDVPSG